jgi:D-alanine-D-alanine ligase-like ATP-grasp enzyme
MKKKARAATLKAAKRRKGGVGKRKAAPGRAGAASEPALEPPLSVAPNGVKSTIRRLRAHLAQALERIEELQASADTDFLLESASSIARSPTSNAIMRAAR